MNAPHLVIKRGNHGRYRFALMTEAGRITGEVAVHVGGDRALARAGAVAKIATLAQTLAAALTEIDADRHLDAPPYPCDTERMDKGAFANELILGGRHG